MWAFEPRRFGKKKQRCRGDNNFCHNRLQFNQAGDFMDYPRTLEEDFKKLEIANNDIVFCPEES